MSARSRYWLRSTLTELFKLYSEGTGVPKFGLITCTQYFSREMERGREPREYGKQEGKGKKEGL